MRETYATISLILEQPLKMAKTWTRWRMTSTAAGGQARPSHSIKMSHPEAQRVSYFDSVSAGMSPRTVTDGFQEK